VETYPTDELWVATEKVHGTNFSFIYDGETLRHAKRSSFLKDTDSFNNFQAMSKKHADKVKTLFTHLRADIPTLKVIKIFGEFYGGLYPDVKGKSKAIQKTIFYSPEVDFEAFDLFYETTDGES
jgi:Rnl2 family RNA ligase